MGKMDEEKSLVYGGIANALNPEESEVFLVVCLFVCSTLYMTFDSFIENLVNWNFN